jgi:hypothetical protein
LDAGQHLRHCGVLRLAVHEMSFCEPEADESGAVLARFANYLIGSYSRRADEYAQKPATG